jgi:hypothetical protein
MTIEIFCFYLQNRLIQTSQTGGQRYSDTSPFSIPWTSVHFLSESNILIIFCKKSFYEIGSAAHSYFRAQLM